MSRNAVQNTARLSDYMPRERFISQTREPNSVVRDGWKQKLKRVREFAENMLAENPSISREFLFSKSAEIFSGIPEEIIRRGVSYAWWNEQAFLYACELYDEGLPRRKVLEEILDRFWKTPPHIVERIVLEAEGRTVTPARVIGVAGKWNPEPLEVKPVVKKPDGSESRSSLGSVSENDASALEEKAVQIKPGKEPGKTTKRAKGNAGKPKNK